MIKYIGKTLLIEEESERVLVVGDLHLGFERVLRESGVMLPMKILEEILRNFDLIFGKVGKVEKVILLGDIKHDFGRNEIDEYKEIGEIMNYLRKKCKEVVIVKGNHDAVVGSVVNKLERVKLVNYFLSGKYGFVHGDKDFPEIHDKNINNWVMGHGHPAVNLSDGTKIEKYKCFLVGSFEKRKVTIVPSFFSVSEGTDPREFEMKFAWKFNLEKFEVQIVSNEDLEVLDFGELGNLKIVN